MILTKTEPNRKKKKKTIQKCKQTNSKEKNIGKAINCQF